MVFKRVRELALLPKNDFSWSGWENAADALREIDAIASLVQDRRLPRYAEVLFFPTGPLQELSLSSGWGDEFLRVATWFYEAKHAVDCVCADAPIKGETRELGMSPELYEVGIITCPHCGREWLRLHYELEAFTASGRWYLGALPKFRRREVSLENAAEILLGMPWYFAGGSYFNGEVVLWSVGDDLN